MPRPVRYAMCAWLAASVSSPALAQQPQGSWYGPHMMWGGGWYGMFLGPIMMIVFIAVVVIVVVLLVRWLGGAGHHAMPPAPPNKTALDILKERFARGDQAGLAVGIGDEDGPRPLGRREDLDHAAAGRKPSGLRHLPVLLLQLLHQPVPRPAQDLGGRRGAQHHGQGRREQQRQP